MIVIDTNVISELVKPVPELRVIAWADGLSRSDVYITAITCFALLYGVAILPEGRRRTQLAERHEQLFETLFRGRILPFDEMSACCCATIAANCHIKGKPIALEDLQIAAIAFQYGIAVATRNTTHFDHEGLSVINPWNS